MSTSDLCESELEAHDLIRKTVAEEKYKQDRDGAYCRENLPRDFGARTKYARLWVDSGGGYGIAQEDFLKANEFLRTVNITMTNINEPKNPRHQDWMGTLLEDYPQNAISDADLITDYYGASYSSRPDLILQRFNDWLAPEGRAYIVLGVEHLTSKQSVDGPPKVRFDTVHMGSRSISLVEWIILHSGMDCTLEVAVNSKIKYVTPRMTNLICKKTAGLKVKPLRLIGAVEDWPPIREFRQED